MYAELTVFFSAMTPFLDLKLAIPLGHSFGLSAPTIFLFSVAGSIVPAALTLKFIDPVSKFARKHSKKMDKFFAHLFDKTRKDHSKKFQRYGAIFLVAFVALPLPGSGSVGGSIIAFLFGVDYWKALALISLGIAITGGLLLAGFESVFKLLDLFA